MAKAAAIIDPRKRLLNLIQTVSYGHSTWEVFSDFLELYALAMANSVDLLNQKREAREARYMQTIKKYKPEQAPLFAEMGGCLVMALEEGPDDVLGRIFHDLELHNKYNGQFFTPFELCKMMARMTIGGDLKAKIEQNGFITVSEPACGSGAMVIAQADAMKAEGLNPQSSMHVTCVDVDLKCVHMAFLQLSLLGIPAVVVHGNTLTLAEWDRFYTPAHIWGFWDSKLRRSREAAEVDSPIEIPVAAAVAVGGQISLFG